MLDVFLRHGSIAAINLAVDIYNCISLETLLSLGAHDIDQLNGSIALRMTDGSEHFTPLGKERAESIPAGEYGYVEEGGRSCVAWNAARQSGPNSRCKAAIASI